MAIGDKFSPTALTTYDCALMAQECRLNPKLASYELKQLADKICAVWSGLQDGLLELDAEPSVLEEIGPIFYKNAGMPLRSQLKSRRFA